MPFDLTGLSGALPAGRAAGSSGARRLVASWLLGVAAMIGAMVVLGGATRLSGSGLSIMEWAPISGTLPPLSEAEWRRLFALYQQIPQYHLLHEGMGIAGFKRLFWLEWLHRLWGRLLGVAFLLPLLGFWLTGRLRAGLRARLVVIFALGALQGAVGWFMVASGFFPASTAVAAPRLVIHLGLALLLYAVIFWTALSEFMPVGVAGRALRPARRAAQLALGAIVLTILAGGFVAGIHAGLDYNTFPLMDGRLVPAGYARMAPLWRNFTENIATVQFDHRLAATLSAIAGIATALLALIARPLPRRVRLAGFALLGAIVLQYGLGVATLLLVVPLPLAVAHQGGAVLLLTAVLAALHALRPRVSYEDTP